MIGSQICAAASQAAILLFAYIYILVFGRQQTEFVIELFILVRHFDLINWFDWTERGDTSEDGNTMLERCSNDARVMLGVCGTAKALKR